MALQRITIVSGGQTGADRAALDFAIAYGIPHGGWCPRGRQAEDGPIPDVYRLTETPSHRYQQRTWWNVRDSDATVVFTTSSEVQGGTALTLELAKRLDKPVLVLAPGAADSMESSSSRAADTLLAFLKTHHVRRLNIAGPRASQQPQVADWVTQVLRAALDLPADQSQDTAS